jgi:hypothetical protein
MAKQTFTTGQVLTAAQMTSLQQTAMSGGAASAKTASYTLVAADAGTAISMSNASATTITVNTALFAAGDTVQITNLGAGVCTITAGTATVNTSASLALAQYESGTLDFTSTSAAIFIKGAGAAASAGGADWSLLNSGGTALTGASTITVSGISGKDKIMIMVNSASSASASSLIQIRLNGDTDYVYQWYGVKISAGSTYSSSYLVSEEAASNMIRFGTMSSNADSIVSGTMSLTGCNASGVKVFNSAATGSKGSGNDQIAFILGGYYNKTATISSISVVSGTGNFDAGTVYVYTSA